MSAFKYFMKINIAKHVKADGGGSNEVEACMATKFWFVLLYRPPTAGPSQAVVEVGDMHKQHS